MANCIVQSVDASRLMGVSVIITELSPTIAQTLVTNGVNLSKMTTVGARSNVANQDRSNI